MSSSEDRVSSGSARNTGPQVRFSGLVASALLSVAVWSTSSGAQEFVHTDGTVSPHWNESPALQENVDIGTELSLTAVESTLGFDDFYRSPTGLGETDFWIELAKDDGTFFYLPHPCFETSDLAGFFDPSGTQYSTVERTYRVGPHDESGSVAILPFGEDWITDAAWEDGPYAVEEIRFLTSGTHSNAGTVFMEPYLVQVDYSGGQVSDVYQIDMPFDHLATGAPGATISSSSGDAVCTGIDEWCLFETGDEAGPAAIDCDLDGNDRGHLWEVVLFPSAAPVTDVLIFYQPWDKSSSAGGLGGAIAVTMSIDESTYDGMFLDDGTYQTSAIAPEANSNLLFHSLEWDQVLNGGELEVRFSCGGTPNLGQDWSDSGDAYPFTEPSDGTVARTLSNEVLGVGPADHCNGEFFAYSVEMVAGLDVSPEVSEVRVRYGVDQDADGFVASGLLPDYQTLYDVCDDNPATQSELAWYPDCDGDGAFLGVDFPACSAADAVADDQVCAAGNGNGGSPYDVSSTAPGSADCNDMNAELQFESAWYPDCDGDGIFADVASLVACGADAALGDGEACGAGNGNGGAPYDVTAGPPPAPDCDDVDPSASVVDSCGICGGDGTTCSIFADGFESGSTIAWQ